MFLPSFYWALLSRHYTPGSLVTTQASSQKVLALMWLWTTLLALEGFSHLHAFLLSNPRHCLASGRPLQQLYSPTAHQLSSREESNSLPRSWSRCKRGTPYWFPFHLPKQESLTSVCMSKRIKNTTETPLFLALFLLLCFSAICSTSLCWALCSKQLPILHVKGVQMEGKETEAVAEEVWLAENSTYLYTFLIIVNTLISFSCLK